MSGDADPLGDRLTRRLADEPEGRLLKAGDIVAQRFEIDGPLGEGGSGAVYKARDRDTGRTVALKIILPHRLARPGAREALASEAAIARDIRHPNIVGVYDISLKSDPPFISMEFVDGRSLWDWMKQYRRERRPWPMATAAAIIRNVLDGLEAAHAAGVIHRDIKPENVILTAEPTAAKAPLKIIDFGIAQAGASRLSGLSSEGTKTYMAPESAYGDELTEAADLYSLSVVFYELLVAAPPMHWREPSNGRSDTPAAIDALIHDGLSPNAFVRPQSAAEYRRRLLDALAGKAAAPAAPAETPRPDETPSPSAAPKFDAGLSPKENYAVKTPAATPAAPRPPAPGPEPPKAVSPPPARPAADAPLNVPATLERAQTLADKARSMTRSQTAGWNVAWDNAHQLYKQAAATGDPEAKRAYGRFLEQGHGMWVAPQYDVARSWYESAAKDGYAPAMIALGDMDRFGRGGPKNPTASIAWYVKAGEAGFAQGDYMAGFAYRAKLRDWGGLVDHTRARHHLERAASKGDAAAMLHLGEMLAEGQGGPKDRAGAKAWFERALKAGQSSAADSLKTYGLR